MSRRSSDLDVVRQFQSECDAIRHAPEPIPARLTVLTLASLLIACCLLAGFTQIDRVVVSQRGKVVSVEGPRIFQALDAAIIKTLDVKEGEIVKKGQLLATLDPTFTGADVEQLEQQVSSLEAQIARAQSELSRKAFNFPAGRKSTTVDYYVIQKALFDQRAQQYDSQINSFNEKIAQATAGINRLRSEQVRYEERERISHEIEKMRQQLLEKQAGSYLNLLIASDQRIELMRNMQNGRNTLVELEHQLKSLEADREAFVQQWFATASQERVTALNTLSSTEAQLTKARRKQSLVRIEAADDSVVLSRARSISVGSVLKEGETLLTLMPLTDKLEAEIHIATRDVGFVRANDPAALKVDAFRFVEHGEAEGRVNWISEGAFTTDENGSPVEPFYKARIAVTKMKFVRVPESFRLIPGMTLQADIHVGNRSVLAYLFGTVVKGLGEAMREP